MWSWHDGLGLKDLQTDLATENWGLDVRVYVLGLCLGLVFLVSVSQLVLADLGLVRLIVLDLETVVAS